MKRTAMPRSSGFARPQFERVPTASLSVPVMRKCKVTTCRTLFANRSMTHVACSPECAQIVAAAKREKEARAAARLDAADTRAKREAMKSRKKLTGEAQEATNAYVRLRDAGRPCICCGSAMEPDKPGGAVDAGHYLSVGSAPHLRFELDNIHAQRKNCNRPGGTTRQAFKAGMVARIGLARVEALEADQEPRKYSADELRALRDERRAMTRALKTQQPATL